MDEIDMESLEGNIAAAVGEASSRDARRALYAALQMHGPTEFGWCSECAQPQGWPCPTVTTLAKALGVAVPDA